ncbi:MAG: hypothetical protein PHE02_02290 [Lachnospiraceae bacterium]|nr:hypothetical protein [Lachnospiraceae bacterium]
MNHNSIDGNPHRILPFYMTYPLPMYYEDDNKVMRDLEYLQQLYPAEAKKYQKRIASILDKIDYDGSLIYDEYPDRWLLYKLSKDVLETLRSELAIDDKEPDISAEKWEWISDLIQILLYYEIYKRRHSHGNGILRY